MTIVIGHTLGFPRIGSNRELKYALEQYWDNKICQDQLLKIGRTLRAKHWKQQKKLGIDLIPVGDFAWYDNVLTTSLMLNNIPIRHKLPQENLITLDTLFRISRGYYSNGTIVAPSEMKKWFNTNYHYIVPEFIQGQTFQLNWMQLFNEIDEALSLNYQVKPILLGPISYLWIGKTKGIKFNKLSLLPSLLLVYQKILDILSKKNINWVQIDEPVLTLELPIEWIKSYLSAYSQLHGKVKLLLTTYFDGIYHQLDIITQLKIDGLHTDLVSDSSENISLLNKKLPKHWILSAGVINGRNIWKTNLYLWYKKLYPLTKQRTLWIGSSCSLLHSPIDLNLETKLSKNTKEYFAFALQKCSEIKMLCNALNIQNTTANDSIYIKLLIKYYDTHHPKSYFNKIHDLSVQKRCKNISNIANNRSLPYSDRKKLQKKRFNLPIYPTTTIGSFPQTKEIRNLRLCFKNMQTNEDNYELSIKNYIKKIIAEQEALDLDVLVHGEPERNDMVEYFGELLQGFIFTDNGWVQSYGSRCVKPPIIIGDISRPKPMTIKWITYAQSLTKKPVKGILTGPITITSWSFLREDIQRDEIVLQLALAIKDEVMDLEQSGIGIIQIDEPALREGLPLKASKQKQYLEWAVNAFKITVSSVKNDTQIHTHMCYSEFKDIMSAIMSLDADVISIEAARSDPQLLIEIKNIIHNLNDIGLGIYDIHSPNQPTKNDFLSKLQQFIEYIPKKNLWVNPDCGLKTRSWPEIKKTLFNMVSAAKILRIKYYTDN